MKLRFSKREINRQRWRELIGAWKEGNQTQKAFCEAHHVRLASFQRWRRSYFPEADAALTHSRGSFWPAAADGDATSSE